MAAVLISQLFSLFSTISYNFLRLQKNDRPISHAVAGDGRSERTARAFARAAAVGTGIVYLTLFPLQQEEGQAGRDGLRGRERGPDAVHPEEGAQHQRAGHDGHDAAGKRLGSHLRF